jgi:hypothetical protein
LLRTTGAGLTLQRYLLVDGVITQESVWNFRWPEVQRIAGFKRDCITVDQICIEFTLNNWAVEINEEMDGYKDVVAAMSKHFPDMNAQWWESVTFPPFAASLTIIWPTAQATRRIPLTD